MAEGLPPHALAQCESAPWLLREGAHKTMSFNFKFLKLNSFKSRTPLVPHSCPWMLPPAPQSSGAYCHLQVNDAKGQFCDNMGLR